MEGESWERGVWWICSKTLYANMKTSKVNKINILKSLKPAKAT